MSNAAADLAAHLHDQGNWRNMKAEEYPEDRRNAESANGLWELSEFVVSLHADHHQIARLQGICDQYGLEVFALLGEDTRRFISRYRFDRSHQISGEEWLEEFVGMLETELQQREAEELASRRHLTLVKPLPPSQP